MKNWIFLAAAVVCSIFPATADAACTCRCVNGLMQPICSIPGELAPICPAMACALPPAALPPLAPLGLPPLGTQNCAPQQVQNPYTHQYEWKSICR